MTIEQTRPSHQDRTERPGTAPGGGRIVVGVDGSPGSLAALRWALREAAWQGVDVQALGAWSFRRGRGHDFPADLPTPGDALAKAVEATVTAATAQRPGGPAPLAVTVTSSVIQGDPAWELPAAAVDGDLLVVGSRGHGEVVEFMVGSVAQHVVSRARSPVVVVPDVVPDESSSP